MAFPWELRFFPEIIYGKNSWCFIYENIVDIGPFYILLSYSLPLIFLRLCVFIFLKKYKQAGKQITLF